jgi:hypothetical protein
MTGDILDDFERSRRPRAYPITPATTGLVVEDRSSGFCGDVVGCTAQAVSLRDRAGRVRQFVLKPGGFLIDGTAVTLVRPTVAPSSGAATARLTNSGAVAAGPTARAQVARASRIWVEGRHDAELIEHVWGDDLRELGIVVEPMHGLDDVRAMVAAFAPGPQRRLGVLVDHLVTGSKEDRLVAPLRQPPLRDHVLVTGHPFVDVWEGIRPDRLGLQGWPEVPRTLPWKEGMCAALAAQLGRAAVGDGTISGWWPVLRSKVKTYADLRPELVGAVERVIDFVSEA